jgi:hypothetical protein
MNPNLLNAERLKGTEFLEKLEDIGFEPREAHSLALFLTEQAHQFRRASQQMESTWAKHTHSVSMVLEVNVNEGMIVGIALERGVNEFFVREISKS